MKHFLKQFNKMIIDWVTTYAVWILFGTIFLYTGLLIIYRKFHWLSWVFDDSDKTNIIQIILFIGVIMVLYESIRIREQEHQPIINLFVKIKPSLSQVPNGHEQYCIDITENSIVTKVFYLVVRNEGKGTGYNLKIALPGYVNSEYSTIQEQTTIVGNGDEVPFKVVSDKANIYKKLKLNISAYSFSNKKFTYCFELINPVTKNIKYLGEL